MTEKTQYGPIGETGDLAARSMTSAAVPTARRREEGKTSVFASKRWRTPAAHLGTVAHAVASVSTGLVRGCGLNSIRVVDPASHSLIVLLFAYSTPQFSAATDW